MVRGNLPAYASNIRRLLRERELTHVAFSKQVGLSPQSTYTALAGGDIRVSTLIRTAKALNVEPWTLMQPQLEHREALVPPEAHDLSAAIATLLSEMVRGKK
jgi:transcriptional regulator with XRE-family HTH domain